MDTTDTVDMDCFGCKEFWGRSPGCYCKAFDNKPQDISYCAKYKRTKYAIERQGDFFFAGLKANKAGGSRISINADLPFHDNGIMNIYIWKEDGDITLTESGDVDFDELVTALLETLKKKKTT